MSAEKGLSKRTETFTLPTLVELVEHTAITKKQNKLMVLLNQPPPPAWIKEHPTAKIKNAEGEEIKLPYLPIDKVEYLLTKLYRDHYVEILHEGVMANSIFVRVRLFVLNPITNEWQHNDGAGAVPMQTAAGKGAIDFNFIKSFGVQIGYPAAESFAIKDAAEKFGKIFGRDLARNHTMDYSALLLKPDYDWDGLETLRKEKEAGLSIAEDNDFRRIIENKEVNSFYKVFNILSNK